MANSLPIPGLLNLLIQYALKFENHCSKFPFVAEPESQSFTNWTCDLVLILFFYFLFRSPPLTMVFLCATKFSASAPSPDTVVWLSLSSVPKIADEQQRSWLGEPLTNGNGNPANSEPCNEKCHGFAWKVIQSYFFLALICQVPSYIYYLNIHQIIWSICLLEVSSIGPKNSFDQIISISLLFFSALFFI